MKDAGQRGASGYRRGSPLSVEQILAWADAYHARHGTWPAQRSGMVVRGLHWRTLDQALRLGLRGLSGGSSLAKLLFAERGVPVHGRQPRLTTAQILAWADAFRAKRGDWPTQRSGNVEGVPGLTWIVIQKALVHGRHGLKGRSSLARLLRDRRGARRARQPRRLSQARILAWADAFHARHGTWPMTRSGLIDGANGLTWSAVNRALRDGRHRLPGGSSLGALLAQKRSVKQHIRTFLGRRRSF